MQVTDKVTLNLSGEELFAPIFARQGDLNSRIVEATLQFGEALYEIPENTKVVVTYRSANGKSDIHDGAVSGANTVTFPLIPLLLSAPGRARCDVELYNSGDMLGTGLLYVDVAPIAAKSGALETAPMYQTFVDAIADMTNKTADADEAINNANTAAEAANTAAQNAAEKATAAQAAADAANTAKAGADAAAGRANTAATGADTAADSASAAATRATTAAEEAEKVIADVSGELGNIVDTQISGQKGQPNGIASLDNSGKLVQMPTAADVGAVTQAIYDLTLINGAFGVKDAGFCRLIVTGKMATIIARIWCLTPGTLATTKILDLPPEVRPIRYIDAPLQNSGNNAANRAVQVASGTGGVSVFGGEYNSAPYSLNVSFPIE